MNHSTALLLADGLAKNGDVWEPELSWYWTVIVGVAVIVIAYAVLCLLSMVFPRGRHLLDRGPQHPRPADDAETEVERINRGKW